MIKKFFLILLFLLLLYAVWAQGNLKSFDDTIGLENPPVLTEDMKLWLLALPGIIMESNNSSHTTLEVEPINSSSKLVWRQSLKQWWGIKNRRTLLAMIKKMEIDGHAQNYYRLKEIANNEKDKEIDHIVKKYNLDKKNTNYYMFVLYNLDKLNQIDIISWDWGRMTSLIRWGYHVGYLKENEAWWMLLYFGKKIQKKYSSWEEYGNAYATGRIFWASGFGGINDYYEKTKEIYEKLLNKGGAWYGLNWNIELPSL